MFLSYHVYQFDQTKQHIIFTVRKVDHRWSGKLVALSQIVNLSPRQYALDAPEMSKALYLFVSRLLESDAGRFFIKHVPQNFSMPKEMR